MSRAEQSHPFGRVATTERGGIPELSQCAVRYGERLIALPVPALAMRIYDFGRRPLTARLRERLPDTAAVAAFVESFGGPALSRDWHELPQTPHWRRWASRGSSGRIAGKLYVSVAPQALPEAVTAVASAATSSTVAAFKVGADAAGICRADRLVVYVSDVADLEPLGAFLRGRLEGCPADGVPFTHAITTDGLLSWAVDPSSGLSWRQWLTGRLARHLHEAAAAGSPVPGEFALDRLRREGVDTLNWALVTP